jgi:exodeoxyribonuclease X
MTIARVIDFETTGIPEEEHAEVIELGRYDVDLGTHEIGRPWSSLCLPRGPIPAVAKAAHHITEDDVADAPQARELWDQFFDGLSSHDVLVAHNAKFEQHFCQFYFHKDAKIAWVDTYKVARVVWPDAPTHSNQGLRYWLGLELDRAQAMPPHRALPDAYVTAHILVRLLAEKTIEEMVHISKYPALLKIMNFGKHKGMTFEAAPIDYLEWIRDKSDMDEDTKFSAKYWVSKRAGKS